MKTFHDYWFSLKKEERQELALRIDASEGYLERVAGGFSLPSFKVATRIVRATGVSFDEFLAAYEAKHGIIV